MDFLIAVYFILDFKKFAEGLFWKGWEAILAGGHFGSEVIDSPNGMYILKYIH